MAVVSGRAGCCAVPTVTDVLADRGWRGCGACLHWRRGSSVLVAAILWAALLGSCALVPGGLALAMLSARAQGAGSPVETTQPLIVLGSVLVVVGIAGIDAAGTLLIVSSRHLGWWRVLVIPPLVAVLAWWALTVLVGLPSTAGPAPVWGWIYSLPPHLLAWIVIPTASIIALAILAGLAERRN